MKEDSIIRTQNLNEPDNDEDLLLMEAFGGNKQVDLEQPAEKKEEEILLDMLMHKKGTVFDDSMVQERERLLSRVMGKSFPVKYRWFIWDDPNMSEASVLEGCRALVEDHQLLVYNGAGDLRFQLPLNQVMFRAFQSLINVAWFDEEHDNIYYSIEMEVDLF